MKRLGSRRDTEAQRRSGLAWGLAALAVVLAAACSGQDSSAPAAWADRFPLFQQPDPPRDTLTPPPATGRYGVEVGLGPIPHGGAAWTYQATVGALGLDGYAARPRQLCLLGARVWPQTRGIAGPPVWSSMGRGERCATPAEPALAAGGPAHSAPAAALLGDSLAEGWYLPVVRVRADGRVADLPGRPVWVTAVRDTAPPVADLTLLRYRASTEVSGSTPPTLRTTVHLSVAGARNVKAEQGGCAVSLRAYRTPRRTGAPVWDSRRRDHVCGLTLIEYVIGRGMPRDRLLYEVPVPEMMGDSLPDGRYYFTARVRWPAAPPLEGQPATRESAVDIPAGDAELTSRIPPLPAEGAAGSFAIRARTRPVAGRPGMFLTTVTVTNRTAGAAYLGTELRSICAPFVAYRSRRDRDDVSGYPSLRATWEPRACVIPIPDQWLAPRQSRTFGGRFTARAILGDTLPPGRYFFKTGLFPGFPQLSTTLAAGDAVLTRR